MRMVVLHKSNFKKLLSFIHINGVLGSAENTIAGAVFSEGVHEVWVLTFCAVSFITLEAVRVVQVTAIALLRS